jgi:hypothetical protein
LARIILFPAVCSAVSVVAASKLALGLGERFLLELESMAGIRGCLPRAEAAEIA